MSLDLYLATKRRNRVKKQLRKQYPSLMGQQLEDRVDKVLGISDSGSMDWASIKAPTGTSDYPTPKSVKYEDFIEIGKIYKVRPYILYWFYLKKAHKIQAGGRKRYDYKAVLKDLAPSVIGKELEFDTKLVAVIMYAKDLKGVMLTRPQAESMIMEGKV